MVAAHVLWQHSQLSARGWGALSSESSTTPTARRRSCQQSVPDRPRAFEVVHLFLISTASLCLLLWEADRAPQGHSLRDGDPEWPMSRHSLPPFHPLGPKAPMVTNSGLSTLESALTYVQLDSVVFSSAVAGCLLGRCWRAIIYIFTDSRARPIFDLPSTTAPF